MFISKTQSLILPVVNLHINRFTLTSSRSNRASEEQHGGVQPGGARERRGLETQDGGREPEAKHLGGIDSEQEDFPLWAKVSERSSAVHAPTKDSYKLAAGKPLGPHSL